VSEAYHLTSIEVYQLSIAHLVNKDNTSRYKDTYGRVLPCNLSHHHPRTLYIVHNISYAYKVKKDSIFIFYRYYMHRILPCSKERLVSMVLDVYYSPRSSGSASFSYEKTPTTMGPTCDDMHVY
jgi:hypothetical protein